MRLHEVNEAVRMINEAVSPEANIIFGATIDDTLGDEIVITVVAAGFDPATQRSRPAERRVVAEDAPRVGGFDLPMATAAAVTAASTASGFGFGNQIDETVSDATGVIETVSETESEDVIKFPGQTDQGFGDDLDIPDFLK
jgi:cell division protein FtsZ